MERREQSRKPAGVLPVDVRPERDGTFRYMLSMGNQMLVSRESFPTAAEATQAGEAARRAMHEAG